MKVSYFDRAALEQRLKMADVLDVVEGVYKSFMIGAALTAMKNIKTVYCAEPMNLDAAKPYAAACPQRMQEMFGLDASDVQFIPVSDLAESVGKADIIITITRATKPIISRDWVKPGTHLSCIGADMPGKEEVDPAILRDAVVYVDDVDQCVNAGECELAVKGGYMTREHISGQIGEVLLGAKKGRTSAGEITVFDATGLALLDLAVAKKVVEENGGDSAHTINL